MIDRMDELTTEATGPAASPAEAAALALAAAENGPPVTARLAATGVHRLRGSDARSFLHGQVTADITRLAVGEATRSLLLNHRGHALAEAMVLRANDEVTVVVEDGMAAWVGATLAEHIIFDDVTLDHAAAATVTLQGAGASAALAAAFPAAAEALAGAGDGVDQPFWSTERWLDAAGVDRGEVLVYPRRRSAAGGFDLVALAQVDAPAAADRTADQLISTLVAAGALPVPATAIAAARVAAGVSTAGGEGGPGVLPQEADLTQALSYRKGCYLGQEVMARIEARGSLKRGLVTVELEGDAPLAAVGREPGSNAVEPSPESKAARAIELDGRSVGILGTAAVMPDGRVMALAVLRLDLQPGAKLTVGGLGVRFDPAAGSILPA